MIKEHSNAHHFQYEMSYLLTGDTIYLVTKATPAEQITEHKCITVNMSKHFIFNYLIKSSTTTSSSNVSLHLDFKTNTCQWKGVHVCVNVYLKQ